MKIKDVPLSKINRAPYNPRVLLKPGDPAFDRLAKNLDKFNLVRPLVWNERSGNLVEGHQRLTYLEARGDKSVKCSVVDLSHRDERALNIALNNHSGSWEYAQLAELIDDLKLEETFDVDILGFTQTDLDQMLTWKDAAPEIETPGVKRLQIETIAVADLKEHPRNYLQHPEDQLAHIIESIRQNGYYRNIVIANDETVLAGHGVMLAVKRMQLRTIPVIRLDLNPNDPKALKVLTGDNEVRGLAEIDDRVLSDLLKEVKDVDTLIGTGYDDMMLANLLFVTRPASEIQSFDAAKEWVGMPSYENPDTDNAIKISVSFRSIADKLEFARLLSVTLQEGTKSMWWPQKQREDVQSVRFESTAEKA